jgi:hypothetical protein
MLDLLARRGFVDYSVFANAVDKLKEKVLSEIARYGTKPSLRLQVAVREIIALVLPADLQNENNESCLTLSSCERGLLSVTGSFRHSLAACCYHGPQFVHMYANEI